MTKVVKISLKYWAVWILNIHERGCKLQFIPVPVLTLQNMLPYKYLRKFKPTFRFFGGKQNILTTIDENRKAAFN